MTNSPPSAVNLLRTALDRVQDLERALEEAGEAAADEHAFRYTDAIAHMRELRDITARLARLRLYADALESERARALEGERRWAAVAAYYAEAHWVAREELARLRPVVDAVVEWREKVRRYWPNKVSTASLRQAVHDYEAAQEGEAR
jgi:hypothetical protein